MKNARIAFFAASVVALAAAACGTIADLDVKYDSVNAQVDASSNVDPTTTDGGTRVIIRDSSFIEPDAPAPLTFDPSDAGPCNPDTDPDGGCDYRQGLGCCLTPGGGAQCIFQTEVAALCANGVFVGCRADDPTSESACCWRAGPSNSRMSVFAASCDGGLHACDPNADGGGACPGNTQKCVESKCSINGGPFAIGTCGEPAQVCP